MTIPTFGFGFLLPFTAKGIRQPQQAVAVGPATYGSIVRGGSVLGHEGDTHFKENQDAEGGQSMKIPVFVSCPTTLSEPQLASKQLILERLDGLDLEPRAIGVSDFATQSPLREVTVLARHCSGGVILGFEQFRVHQGIRKYGTSKQKEETVLIILPTEWNQLEAGILLSAGLPLLVFREPGLAGGIFDLGVSDVFLYDMPMAMSSDADKRQLNSVFLKWQAEVRRHYYDQ